MGIFTDTALGRAIADFLTSKKALTAIAGTACGFAAHLKWQISPDEMMTILSPIIAYIVGQGIADNGKEAAKAAKREAKK